MLSCQIYINTIYHISQRQASLSTILILYSVEYNKALQIVTTQRLSHTSVLRLLNVKNTNLYLKQCSLFKTLHLSWLHLISLQIFELFPKRLHQVILLFSILKRNRNPKIKQILKYNVIMIGELSLHIMLHNFKCCESYTLCLMYMFRDIKYLNWNYLKFLLRDNRCFRR